MAGITRIKIMDHISGQGSWRFKDSQKCYPEANILYRRIFGNILHNGLDLGEEVKECSKDEVFAGLDHLLGIDVILKTWKGHTITMQEKFLFTKWDTVTVEYYQDWFKKIPGDWFNMKCQCYFTGYDYDKKGIFNKWILLDWLKVQLLTGQGKIPWEWKVNDWDDARANFAFCKFCDFPNEAILAKSF